ncbi:COL12A [Mytilus edulis]|uniref:COL12A n=1 Tax=Mytilus edulis TaxID=6550 RepID=A0A8S3PX57_MYTED|nr:COL12A [Mytilus edulis]
MSPWSEWSDVYGFGERRKERVILRYPDNGGKPCPNDTEITEITLQKPTVQATATQVITGFLQRNLKPNHSSHRRMVKRSDPIGLFRDLLIIIDSSGSIGSSSYEIAKRQTGELIGLLCPVPDPFNSRRLNGYNRAALIQFSTNAVEEFDFDDKHGIAELKAAIQAVPYQNGMTCTGDAFYKAIQMFTSSKGARQGTKHEVLIVTDGKSNCGRSISTVVPMLHAKADVFGLMIGDFSPDGKRELASYVSKPVVDHLFAVDDFRDLERLLNLIKGEIDQNHPCVHFDLSKK